MDIERAEIPLLLSLLRDPKKDILSRTLQIAIEFHRVGYQVSKKRSFFSS